MSTQRKTEPASNPNNLESGRSQTVECDKNVLEEAPRKPSTDVQGSILGGTWPLQKDFSSPGGSLRGSRSAVCLDIPEGAVDSAVEVSVRGAVSTDTENAHSILKLAEDEVIVTPIAEYEVQQPRFRFRKRVSVTLPHFLPARFPKDRVRVYQFRRASSGDVTLQALDKQESGRSPSEGGVGGYFSFDDDSNNVVIHTDHFSGYVCTCMSSELPNPGLRADVFAKDVEKQHGRREVDVLLRVWDERLRIEDFGEARQRIGEATSDRGFQLVASEFLDPLPESANVSRMKIYAYLELKQFSEEEELWKHSTLRSGEIVYPVQNKTEVKTLLPCACVRRGPWCTKWQMVGVTCEQTPRHEFECFVLLGYDDRDDASYHRHRVTLDVKNINTKMPPVNTVETQISSGEHAIGLPFPVPETGHHQ